MTRLTDEDEITFGQYEGKKLFEVPASYLLRLTDEVSKIKQAGLKSYIEDNRILLEREVREERS